MRGKVSKYRWDRAKHGARAIHKARKKRDDSRNDNGLQRITGEIRGKTGEEAVSECFPELGDPDYRVVDRPDHSADFTFMIAGVDTAIPCKTCAPDMHRPYYPDGSDINHRFGVSWTLDIDEYKRLSWDIEVAGKPAPNYLFKDTDRVVFVIAEMDGSYEISGWCTLADIRTLLSRELIFPTYEELKYKRCVYLSDLIEQGMLRPPEDLLT